MINDIRTLAYNLNKHSLCISMASMLGDVHIACGTIAADVRTKKRENHRPPPLGLGITFLRPSCLTVLLRAWLHHIRDLVLGFCDLNVRKSCIATHPFVPLDIEDSILA